MFKIDTGTEEALAVTGELVPDQQRTPTGSEEEDDSNLFNFDRRLKRRNQKNRVEAER